MRTGAGSAASALAVALAALRELRRRAFDFRLFRTSPLPLSDVERSLLQPDRYDVSIRAADMPAWYHGLDLLLFAPYPEGEGLGLPPLEAMAAGVPVVLTDVPSLRFVPEEAASRVGPGDVAGLADAVEALLTDPALWARRRAAGLDFALQHRDLALGPEIRGIAAGHVTILEMGDELLLPVGVGLHGRERLSGIPGQCATSPLSRRVPAGR